MFRRKGAQSWTRHCKAVKTCYAGYVQIFVNRYAAQITPTETIYSHSLTTRIIDIAINPYPRTLMILDGSYPSQTIYVSLVDIYLCG